MKYRAKADVAKIPTPEKVTSHLYNITGIKKITKTSQKALHTTFYRTLNGLYNGSAPQELKDKGIMQLHKDAGWVISPWLMPYDAYDWLRRDIVDSLTLVALTTCGTHLIRRSKYVTAINLIDNYGSL